MALFVWILASVFVVAGAKKCDHSHVNTCTSSMGSLDFNNLDKACKDIADVKTCLDSLKARCPALKNNIDSGLAGIDQQINTYCSPSGCSPVKIVKCSSMMNMENMGGAPTKETCELMSQPIKCFEEVLATCPEGQEKKTFVGQLNMLKQQHQMCVAMTGGGGGPMNPGQGGQACSPEGLMQCHMLGAGAQADPSDAKANCKALGDSKTCLEQLSANCGNSPFASQIINATSAVSIPWAMFCAGSQGDCSADMAKCSRLMQAEAKDESPTVLNCDSLMKAVRCMEALRSTCSKAMMPQLEQLLSSVNPQYQTCTQKGENDQSSTKKPTKKPKGDQDQAKTEEDNETNESKDMKHEDNKKGLTTGDDESGSSLTTASFLLAVAALGIIALVQGRF